MENFKEQYTKKKKTKNWNWMFTYCEACWWRVTPPTSKDHYWTLMLFQTLFKSFKNDKTKRKKETRTNTKGRRKLKKILAIRIVCYIKWKTIKNNTKKKKEIELKCLRTPAQVGQAGHRPLRNITIDRWCTTKRYSNHSITIKHKGLKRQEQIPKQKIIGNKISELQSVIIK